MPTITERRNMTASLSFHRETACLALGALAAAVVWFGGMGVMALLVDPPALLVFAPAASLEQAIDRTGAAVVGFGQGYVVARAQEPGLARRLYAQGVWFVWPAVNHTCIAAKPRAG